MVGRLRAFVARHVVGFVLGAVAVTAISVQAAPVIFGAQPIASCTDGSNDALSTSSETIYAANPQRVEACVENNSSTITIYIARGATATAQSDAVPPLGSWCITDNGTGWDYKGAITGLAASGTPDIGGQECVR